MNYKPNLLLLTHHFLPYSPSFGQTARLYFMAEHFSNKFNVYVVAASGKKEYGYFGCKINDNINISYIFDKNHREVEQIDIPKGTRFKKLIYVNKHYEIKRTLNIISNRVRSLIEIDRYEPVVSKLYQESMRLIGKKDISIVIISPPPFSLLKISSRFKKSIPNLKIIIDYRDSWVVPALIENNLIKNIRSRHIEKKSILDADGVVFISPSMKNTYDDYYKICSKTKLFTNGFNSNINFDYEDNNDDISFDRNVVGIGYFGKIHIGRRDYFRDIRKFFDFFKESDEEFKSHFQLDIYGYFSGDYMRWYKSVPFKYYGLIDKNQIQSKMKNYDFLLLFHTENVRAEEVLTGKVFEYLLAKKPVIVLGPHNMVDARNLIEKNNLGIFINIDDVDDMKGKLHFLYSLKKSGRIKNYFNKNFDLAQFDRRKINEKYAQFIKNI